MVFTNCLTIIFDIKKSQAIFYNNFYTFTVFVVIFVVCLNWQISSKPYYRIELYFMQIRICSLLNTVVFKNFDYWNWQFYFMVFYIFFLIKFETLKRLYNIIICKFSQILLLYQLYFKIYFKKCKFILIVYTINL